MKIDFNIAKKSFVEKSIKGMEKIADDLNERFATAFWYDETEGLEELLADTEDFIEDIEVECDLKQLNRDYFFGFIWGIENITRSLFNRNKNYEKVDIYLRTSKKLQKTLNYLGQEEIVEQEELITHLNTTEKEFKDFINDIEDLDLVYIDGLGKTIWYALTGFAREYIEVRKNNFVDINILKDTLEESIMNYTDKDNETLDFINQNLLLKNNVKKELSDSITKSLNFLEMKYYFRLKNKMNNKESNDNNTPKYDKEMYQNTSLDNVA